MILGSLPGLLAGEEAIAGLLSSDDCIVAVPEAGRALVLASLCELGSAPVTLVVTSTGRETEQLHHDLIAFLGAERVEVLPAWETLPFERVSPAFETMGRRLRAIWRLRSASEQHGTTGVIQPRIVVAPVRALLQRLGPDVGDIERLTIGLGGQLSLDDLVERLVHSGYRREYQVEHRGEFAVRGGIVDIFASTAESGYRIDLWGDEVERLTEFDVADQRSVSEIERIEIFGCRELVLSDVVRRRAGLLSQEASVGREAFERLAEGVQFDGMESWLPWLAPEERIFPDLLPEGARVALVEPRRLRDRAAELVEEEAALADSLAATWRQVSSSAAQNGTGSSSAAQDGTGSSGAAPDPTNPRLHLPFDRMLSGTSARVASLPSVADGPQVPSVVATGWPPVHGDSAILARRLGELAQVGNRVVVCADGAGSATHLRSVLAAEGLDTSVVPSTESQKLRLPAVHLVVASIDRGALFPGAKLALLAEADITGRRRPHRVARPRARAVEGFFDDLEPGDYVVHHVHGVARFAGLVKRSLSGSERDYLLLEYRGGDKLYVPSDQIDSITPYSGGDRPSLNRLNGSDWAKQKARVRSAVRQIARELVQLYRRRASEPGHAFSADTPWQRELELAFVYPETPDQLTATVDVKEDMERPVPMDRLVCGDVGFGKTEVALRAVFKAVQDGFQAAVLVPTTLLAQQHYQTFAERYAPYPMRVEMLSRFLTASEARAVVKGLADGSVDVVIGTHRLLADDVSFKRLGLLVVDEEQRFGVSHKEAIKQLSTGVDVLTLTASPIPRTLEMSLTGIRDLSLINTPPTERQPILTYVGEYDERAVSEAIRRELLREGQVFFVHNRVHDIDKVAHGLRGLVPDARIAVAHGQMDEGSLEQIVLDFSEGRYDVLVCTTIIESGIDMPTVNTLVVDRADLLGLGQLHQLRGRVGRADRRAYAYLLFPPDRVLTEQAYERLKTIGEHTELGSGFKIAMRDLEIRGAGNLLGSDQSGHIAAVGYDLYVRMVSEAVSELKGEPVKVPAEITVDLPVKASLPPSYVGREDLRLEAYRRLVEIRDLAGVDDLRSEWLDRYGPPPKEVGTLLAVGRLRAECARTGITEITGAVARPGAGGLGRPGEIVVRLSPVRLPVSAEVRLTRRHPRALLKPDGDQLIVPLPAGEDIADRVGALIGELLPAESIAGAGP